jgi:hypothetical protein
MTHHAMTPLARTWWGQAAEALRSLAARPGSLFVLLLAVNAVARPYAGITHDARLYSAQVLNLLDPGAYGDDLFFRYGSQDQFSLFSPFAAPFVRGLGLELAFFLLYLTFNSVLILALKRLVEALIEDRLVSTLALVFMMAAPLVYGGLNSFHVQETFLTSRLLSNTFVLFGLERVVKGRFAIALGLMVLAMAFNPLMAAGGVFIWAGCWAWQVLPGKVPMFVAVVVGGVTVLVLATPSLAEPILGTMDESWREIVRRATPFMFVSEWTESDWLNAGMGLVGVGAAAFAFCRSNATTRLGSCQGDENSLTLRRGRFLAMVTAVSLIGLVGTAVAENLPYALLVQGQAYRALWILKVVQIPFAFWFAARLWSVPCWYGPLGAAALIAALGLTTNMILEWCFPLFFLPLLIVRYRGLSQASLLSDWWRPSLAGSLVIGFTGWALYKLVLLFVNHATAVHLQGPLNFARLLLGSVGPVTWVLLFALFVAWAARRLDFGRGFQGATLALVLLVQSAMALLQAVPFFRENCTRYGKDIHFVQEFLRHGQGGGKGAGGRQPSLPTIYSCLGQLDLVWLDLHAKSYFDWWQLSGVMFGRETAVEGQRRALLVGPFEVNRFREIGVVPAITRKNVSRFFAVDFDSARAASG